MFWEETWAFDASDPAGTEESSLAELSHIIWVSDVDFTTGVQIRAHLLDEGSQDLLDHHIFALDVEAELPVILKDCSWAVLLFVTDRCLIITRCVD